MLVQNTKEEVQSFYKNNGKILSNLQANHNSVYEEIKTVFKDRIKEIQNLTKGDKNG
jgi:fibrillarin-like rRNA methylase